jgi:hypothetical protein
MCDWTQGQMGEMQPFAPSVHNSSHRKCSSPGDLRKETRCLRDTWFLAVVLFSVHVQ